MIRHLFIAFLLLNTSIWANGPRLPLAAGGQFEVLTNMGKSDYTITPFISGYLQGIGHVKVGAMIESYESRADNTQIYETTKTRIFGQVGVDLVILGGGSYFFYKFNNEKLEIDNTAGDSDWLYNHSLGIGAQHYLDPFLGLTAELEYFPEKKSINKSAPTEAPLSQTVIQINLGILFFIY